MTNPEIKSQFLSLKKPTRRVLPKLDEILLNSWNLTPKNEDEIGFRSYQNGICGVSVAHSRKEGVLLVAVTSLSEMDGFATKAAVSNVEAIQDTLQPVYGSCDVMPNWVGPGRGAVLVFGGSPKDETIRQKIEDLRPRVASILPHRSFP